MKLRTRINYPYLLFLLLMAGAIFAFYYFVILNIVKYISRSMGFY
ncbi:unnamed protein product [marine sediment metagenome]|uniref:Uncharacterized protein n=1 Tax=marine sediment metagenome TaxID=412755 RepID=X1KE52_9ZZZZ